MISMSLAAAAIPVHGEMSGENTIFQGCSTDSRTVNPGVLFIALRGENFNGHDYLQQAFSGGASAAMVELKPAEQGLPVLLVENTRQAMGELASYWRSRFDIPLIAVTGSNGKTTVKEMLAQILSQLAPVVSTRGNLNNDIGVPLTLFELAERHRYAIVEMGANHAGEILALTGIAKPTIAIITQCAPAHLLGFGTVDDVARAKAEIFANLPVNGTAIINIDDKYADDWIRGTSHLKQILFGTAGRADVRSENVSIDPETGSSSFTLVTAAGRTEIRLALPGRHNIQNALAAAACCLTLDIPMELVQSGLEKMHPVNGRMQFKNGIRRSRIYDDSYNANPGSLEAALKTLGELNGSKWLVLGDMAELGPEAEIYHQHAGKLARKYGIEKLFTLGTFSKFATDSFGNGARHFSSAEKLTIELQGKLVESTRVLVKGSRSMAMERVVAGLVEGY